MVQHSSIATFTHFLCISSTILNLQGWGKISVIFLDLVPFCFSSGMPQLLCISAKRQCFTVVCPGLYSLTQLLIHIKSTDKVSGELSIVCFCVPQVSDHGVSHIALNCPKLRYLNVRGCEAVSDRGLELLARSCLRLRSLDVGKCDITDAGLYALSTYCPQLRKLGLKSCDGVTDRGLVLVAYKCPQLRQLHVQDCSRLTSEAYSMVRRYCKGAFIEHTNPGVL